MTMHDARTSEKPADGAGEQGEGDADADRDRGRGPGVLGYEAEVAGVVEEGGGAGEEEAEKRGQEAHG